MIRYEKACDGLRAIALLGVTAFHVCPHLSRQGPPLLAIYSKRQLAGYDDECGSSSSIIARLVTNVQ